MFDKQLHYFVKPKINLFRVGYFLNLIFYILSPAIGLVLVCGDQIMGQKDLLLLMDTE